MKKTALALAMASLLPSINALADDDQDNVIVTATRFESKLNESLAPVEVITHKQIEDLQAQSLSEVLRRLPGVQVADNGGPTQTTSLYIRGRATKNVLVLINGVRVGSATTGYANLAAIPLHGVSRIEVLRGPRAAVYGSDAVSGVVNIITEQGKNGETNITAGYGSDEQKRVSGSLALANDEQWLNMSATYQASEGYDALLTDTGYDGDFDDDGYRDRYLVTDFGKQFNDNWLLKVNGYYQKQYTEYDGYGGADKTDNDLYNLAAITQYQQDRWQSHFSLAANQDKSDNYGNSSNFLYKTNRYTASWDNEYQISEPLAFVGGVEWYYENAESTYITGEDSRDNGSVYVGSYLNPGDFSLDSNFRFDHNSAYGSFGTYQFAAGYFVTDNIRLVVSYGTSFKAPTYNDLYSSFGSNPDLDVEKNKTGEIAIESNFDLASVRLSTYRNEVKDLITTSYDANYVATVDNVEEAVIKGFELSSSFDTGPLSHQVSYDYLDTENKSTGEELARRARHSAKWNTAYNIKQWHFDVSYLYQGTRQDSVYNDVVLSPYSLVDFAMSYSFNNGVKLGGKVGNVFDEDYETASGYATPERNYYGSISYTF